MPLDTEFYQAVEHLKAPKAGTELMGPLLYALLRSTRPENVLEVGMGYTTPFIIQALVDNEVDFKEELAKIKQKNKAYIEAIEGEDARVMKPGSKPLECMWDWMADSPCLANPEYYLKHYQPVFHAIDNYSSANSHSSQVAAALKRLKLDKTVDLHLGDFRQFVDKIVSDDDLLDFVWFDCGNAEDYKDFIELYWKYINPNGGMLLLHNTLNRYSFHAVMNYFKQLQGCSDLYDVEVLSLLEPHKITQGSVTLVKKVKREVPKFPVENAYTILEHIKKIT